LARRAYTEWELCERLKRRGVAAAEVADAVRELKRRGLINDDATATSWAQSWRDRKGWGPLRVRAELGRRGIGRPLADDILRECFPSDDLQVLVERAAVALARRPTFQRAGRQQARWLAAQLQRRGFPHDAIRRVILSRCPSAKEDDNIGPND
jgi:regulatory protein